MEDASAMCHDKLDWNVVWQEQDLLLQTHKNIWGQNRTLDIVDIVIIDIKESYAFILLTIFKVEKIVFNEYKFWVQKLCNWCGSFLYTTFNNYTICEN